MPPPVAIESILDKAAANWPDRVAIDFYDRTLTFAQLHDLAIRAAKGFQSLGVGPGINGSFQLRPVSCRAHHFRFAGNAHGGYGFRLPEP